jgi:hypothetical protein
MALRKDTGASHAQSHTPKLLVLLYEVNAMCRQISVFIE